MRFWYSSAHVHTHIHTHVHTYTHTHTHTHGCFKLVCFPPREVPSAFVVMLVWKWKSPSYVWLLQPMDYTVHGILQARILEWVAFPFSRGSSQLRDRTQVSRIAGGFFTSWATRKAQHIIKGPSYKLAWEIWHVYLVGWLTVKDNKKQINNNDIIFCCCCLIAKLGPTSCKPFF